MSDKQVNFVINVTGNAQENITQISQGIQNATTKVSNFTNTMAKIRDVGLAFEFVNRAVSRISSTLSSYEDLSYAQVEAETKLAQVMRTTIGASDAEIQSIKELTAAQQRLGVIGDEVQLAGVQELSTYLTKTSSIQKLIPVLNDMTAQQYGYNATQEQATQIASMMGKVMDGQVGALSRYGYKFDETQEKILKFGTEEQRAATLAEVVESAVGGVNKALAKTPEGAMKNVSNSVGDLKERVGKMVTEIKMSLMPVIENLLEIASTVIHFLEEHKTQVTALAITLGIVVVVVKAWMAAQTVLNVILTANPVGIIIMAIAALIAVIVYLCMKITGWGTLWDAITTFFSESWQGFVATFKFAWAGVSNGFMMGINAMKMKWYEFKEALGFGDSEENKAAMADIEADNKRRTLEIFEAAKEAYTHNQNALDAWDKVSMGWDSNMTYDAAKKKVMGAIGIDSYTSNYNDSSTSNELKDASTNISEGGKNVKNFNITINDGLVKEVTNNFSSSDDDPASASAFMDRLTTALQMIVNDVNYAAQ